jgi:hypothetical protein
LIETASRAQKNTTAMKDDSHITIAVEEVVVVTSRSDSDWWEGPVEAELLEWVKKRAGRLDDNV